MSVALISRVLVPVTKSGVTAATSWTTALPMLSPLPLPKCPFTPISHPCPSSSLRLPPAGTPASESLADSDLLEGRNLNRVYMCQAECSETMCQAECSEGALCACMLVFARVHVTACV
eukprot:2344-Rhodomonas_salina.2